jgi:hypothetical protein
VHGAVLFAMVDTAMGAATMGSHDEGLACASIEVHLRFLRAAAAGRLTSVVKGGRRVVQLEGSVRDESGELIATASGSFAVITAPPGHDLTCGAVLSRSTAAVAATGRASLPAEHASSGRRPGI